MVQDPADPPLLSDFLVRLPDEDDVARGNDPVALEISHRERLREGERLHVVGPSPVQVAAQDPALEGGRLLPGLSGDGGDVDVIQEEQGSPARAAGQPRDQIAAPGTGTDDLGRDAGAFEDRLQELRPSLLSGPLGRVDPDVVPQKSDGLHREPLLGPTRCVGFELLRRLLPARAGENEQEDDRDPTFFHGRPARALCRVRTARDTAART